MDERVIWVFTPAVIAIAGYILFRKNKWYDNNAIVMTAFFFGVMGQSFGPRLFQFESNIAVVIVSSLVTLLTIGLVSLLKVKGKNRDTLKTN